MMKLLTTTLTIILFSFGANAAKVGTLYNYCSKLKSNNFEFNSLNKADAVFAGICVGNISAIINAGVNSCNIYRFIYDQYKKENRLSDEVENVISTGVKMLANSDMTNKQGILSFLNWAEKNPNKFDEFTFQNAYVFLGEPFPCKYKE